MTESRRDRLKHLFAEASGLSAEERPRFLAKHCANDPDLESRLEELLSSSDVEDTFLESPPLPLSEFLELEEGVAERDLSGTRIGAYRLLRCIGSGGMGSVYLAEREEGQFQQHVAIKLPRSGFLGPELARRFRRERQTLASLEHPNIAHLLDGGTTEDGQPYLVMEYVEGEPLIEYCDRRGLSIRERLRIFSEICAAVQFSHARLVVHRDLKPSNVLITEDGIPKLLDFGIAKLIASDGGEGGDDVTATRHRCFTSDYASPEQVRGEAVRVTSDVYSLGVILYELLSGRRPYRLTTSSAAAIERQICEVDPPRPSIGSSTTGSGRGAGDRPDSRRRRRLEGDLDCIVLKAMRKEPEQRYGSVESLAGDLRRHLEGLPVLARKGTLRYLTVRYVRRHRIGLIAGALVIASLSAGLVVARHEARRAREQASAAERVRGFLLQLYQTFDPRSAEDLRSGVRMAVSAPETELLLADLRREPRERLRFLEGLAEFAERFRVDDEAIERRELALEVAIEIGGARGPLAAAAHRNLGRVLHLGGAANRAVEHYQVSRDLFPEGEEPLDMLIELARTLWYIGDEEAARARLEEVIARSGQSPDLIERRIEARIDLAEYLAAGNDLAGAETQLDLALEEVESANSPVHWRASVLHRRSRILWRTPRFREADRLLILASELFRRSDHPDARREIECVLDLARMHCRIFAHEQANLGAVNSRPFDAIAGRTMTRVRQQFGEESLEMAHVHLAIGQLLNATDGRHQVRSALRIYDRRLHPGHPWHLECRRWLLQHLGGEPEGDPLAADLESILFQAPPSDPVLYGELLRTLGLWGLWTLEREGFPDDPVIRKRSYERTLEGRQLLISALGASHPLIEWSCTARMILGLHVDPAIGERSGPQDVPLPRSWPYSRVVRTDDGGMEDGLLIDMDDDVATKLLQIPFDPSGASWAQLWIYGRITKRAYETFSGEPLFHLQVNGSPETIDFDLAEKLGTQASAYRWFAVEVPVRGLAQGMNRITLYKGPFVGFDADAPPSPWEIDNLEVGIDRDSDVDSSWWYGDLHSCCSYVDAARDSSAFIPPTGPELVGHLAQGLEECEGELMMFLEVSVD